MEKAVVWLGMDVHKDTVTMAAYVGTEQQPRFGKTNTKTAVKKHFKKIEQLGEIVSCY
ncbi:MAG: hypothetical protein M1335_04575 [Chloroflexi bacterium]|nr:hypothetical protein [Chloroflexota bacterium]